MVCARDGRRTAGASSEERANFVTAAKNDFGRPSHTGGAGRKWAADARRDHRVFKRGSCDDKRDRAWSVRRTADPWSAVREYPRAAGPRADGGDCRTSGCEHPCGVASAALCFVERSLRIARSRLLRRCGQEYRAGERRSGAGDGVVVRVYDRSAAAGFAAGAGGRDRRLQPGTSERRARGFFILVAGGGYFPAAAGAAAHAQGSNRGYARQGDFGSAQSCAGDCGTCRGPNGESDFERRSGKRGDFSADRKTAREHFGVDTADAVGSSQQDLIAFFLTAVLGGQRRERQRLLGCR